MGRKRAIKPEDIAAIEDDGAFIDALSADLMRVPNSQKYMQPITDKINSITDGMRYQEAMQILNSKSRQPSHAGRAADGIFRNRGKTKGGSNH